MGDALVGSVWRALVGAPVFVLGWRQACTTGGSAGCSGPLLRWTDGVSKRGPAGLKTRLA